MNFLAHAIFADGEDEVLFGAVVADLMKRASKDTLSSQAKDGIQIHQDLDTFLTSEQKKGGPLTQCRKLLNNIVSDYDDPVFDICCDHLIALHWDNLFDTALDPFVSQIYNILSPRILLLPESGQKILQNMIEEDWLLSYRDQPGLVKALKRFADRTRRGYLIKDGVDEIVNTLPIIEPVLFEMLPDIRRHARSSMKGLGYNTETRLRWRESLSLKETSYGKTERK